MQIIEGRLGEPLEDFLERRYTVEGLTDREIAPLLGIDYSTVSRWREKLGIGSRAFGPRKVA
jgi:transposase